jgi:hypothetical protein
VKPQKQGRPPPPVEHQFKPGQSGNPGGKPAGSRNRLTTKFINDLLEDFEENGKDAIVSCRTEDPVSYVRMVASLLPKQVEQTQPLEDLTDAELVAGIALLRSRLTGGAGAGTDSPAEPSQTH